MDQQFIGTHRRQTSARKMWNPNTDPFPGLEGDPVARTENIRGRSRANLTEDQQLELVNAIRRLASTGFPLNPTTLLTQAYVYCERNNIYHNLSESFSVPGVRWVEGFLSSRPELIDLPCTERNTPLTWDIMYKFSQDLLQWYNQLDLCDHPERIYTMDFKTFHISQFCAPQLQFKAFDFTPTDKTPNVHVVTCVNAVGSVIPPMIIFKCTQKKMEYFLGGMPEGALVKRAKVDELSLELINDFTTHLANHKSPGKCLLLMDGFSIRMDDCTVEIADLLDIALRFVPAGGREIILPNSVAIHTPLEELMKEPSSVPTVPTLKDLWHVAVCSGSIVATFRERGVFPHRPYALKEEIQSPNELDEVDIEN